MARGFRGGAKRQQAVANFVERDGERCWYCRTEFSDVPGERLTIDHVVPVSTGGRNKLHNLRLACDHCNRHRAWYLIGDWEWSEELAQRRWIVHRNAMIAAGRWLPKQAFHHAGIRWSSKDDWDCDTCGHGRASTGRTPHGVPCGEWATTPETAWVQWWHEEHRVEVLATVTSGERGLLN